MSPHAALHAGRQSQIIGVILSCSMANAEAWEMRTTALCRSARVSPPVADLSCMRLIDSEGLGFVNRANRVPDCWVIWRL